MAGNIQHFRFQTAAGPYSQLTGLLAGFVFAAMILMLSNPPGKETAQSISVPLFTLLIVFFELIVASFLYSVVTGDESALRPDVLGLLASCIFALAAAEMFLSICWFFKAYEVSGLVLRMTKFVFHGVMLISVARIVTTTGDVLTVRDGIDWKASKEWPQWTLPVGLLPLLGGVVRATVWRPHGDFFPAVVMAASAVVTIAMTLYFGVVSDFAPEKIGGLFPRRAPHVLMWVQGALFALCEAALPD